MSLKAEFALEMYGHWMPVEQWEVLLTLQPDSFNVVENCCFPTPGTLLTPTYMLFDLEIIIGTCANELWMCASSDMPLWWSLYCHLVNCIAVQTIKLVDGGYRLPPPPGCPRTIYDFMIDCWWVWLGHSTLSYILASSYVDHHNGHVW